MGFRHFVSQFKGYIFERFESYCRSGGIFLYPQALQLNRPNQLPACIQEAYGKSGGQIRIKL
jgi:hypothetical protein